jgi:hypothetical protein
VRGLQTLVLNNHVQNAIDGTWKQLVAGVGEIFVIRSNLVAQPFDFKLDKDEVIRSNLVGKPFEFNLDKDEDGHLQSIPIKREVFTEWARDADPKYFEPSVSIWGADLK